MKAPAAPLLLLCMFCPLAGRADSGVFPKGTNLTSLTVINESDLGNTAQRVMIATLQGIVARSSGSQIYITVGSPGYGSLVPSPEQHLRYSLHHYIESVVVGRPIQEPDQRLPLV